MIMMDGIVDLSSGSVDKVLDGLIGKIWTTLSFMLNRSEKLWQMSNL